MGDEDYEDYDVPEVHPDQTAIPSAPYRPGEIGFCYWCSEPAVFNCIDIKLPKRKGCPPTLVSACMHHYTDTILPELARLDGERQERLQERRKAARGH